MTPRTLATTLYAVAVCVGVGFLAALLDGTHVPTWVLLFGVALFLACFITGLCVDAVAADREQP